MNLVENIKSYFTKKERGDAGNAPEGMCPICWGHSEWDGQYYEIKRDNHAVKDGAIYDSFISKIVDEHVRTTHNLKEQYICTTCDKAIN